MLKLWKVVVSAKYGVNSFSAIEALHKFVDSSCRTCNSQYLLILIKIYKNLARLLRQYVEKLQLPKEILGYILSFAVQFITSWSKLNCAAAEETHYIDLLFKEALRLIRLLLEIPKCCAYSDFFPESTTQTIEANREFLINTVLSGENVKALVLALMQRFLTLTNEEISRWNDSSEEFAVEAQDNSPALAREEAVYVIGIIYKYIPSKVTGLFDEIDKFLSLPLSPSSPLNDFITVRIFVTNREKASTILCAWFATIQNNTKNCTCRNT
eukprot:TRINITY_DN15019_c0_g2_i1.p1 TRINITY_DN15019_c0_g2~~TRINITY_DN15019_c0_g2_i1.p1  ORF type:complete len:269 (+),score=41.32 TRINITY_DN15019_c0_g2_i1:737-1543(+)